MQMLLTCGCFRTQRTAPSSIEGDLPMRPTIEEIGPNLPQVLKKFSGKHADWLPPRVKYLEPVAHRSQGKKNRLQHVGAARNAAQGRVPEEVPSKARSELAHTARITSLGVLTASIAHEVNQPLASIVTNGETALRLLARQAPDIETVQELTTRMVADARRASEIIDRVRAMATRQTVEPIQLSLNDIVNESMVFLRHEFQSRSISVSLELAPKLPRFVGDRTQIQQVIVNLAINAVQAMAQSGNRNILVRTTLLDPETLCCSVEDSGPGIDPSHLPRLFDSFFTTKEAGMGIGLAISLTIVEGHGGHITADNNSALGGARFSFTLPCASLPTSLETLRRRQTSQCMKA